MLPTRWLTTLQKMLKCKKKQNAFEQFAKNLTQGAKGIQKGADNLVRQSADQAKLTVNQINKLVDPTVPDFIVTAPPPSKSGKQGPPL